MMASWERGRPARTMTAPARTILGARASRHQAWHSLGHLPHLDQPGTAPWLSFGLAAGVPADRVAAWHRTEAQRRPKDRMRAGRPRSQVIRDKMRAGRPRSQAMPSRRCGGTAKHVLAGSPTARQMSRPSSICIPIPPLGNTLLGKGFNPEPRIDFPARLCLRPTSMEGE